MGCFRPRRRSLFRRRTVDAGVEGHQAGQRCIESRAAELVPGAFPAAASVFGAKATDFREGLNYQYSAACAADFAQT